MTIPVDIFAQHIAIAALLGALVGIERQWHQGMAGLRTNALVCTGAAAFVSLPVLLGEDGSGPAHMAAYIISGIGFLGAGVIMREGANIRGLNTAATLWIAAAMGAFAGAGLTLQAVVIAAAILSINLLMRPVVQFVNWLSARFGSGAPVEYEISIGSSANYREYARAKLMDMIKKSSLAMRSLEIQEDPNGKLTITAQVIAYYGVQPDLEKIITEMSAEPSVVSATWKFVQTADSDNRLHLGS